jgi:proline iminopeptidase
VPVAVWLSPHLDALATGNRRIIYCDPRRHSRSDRGDLARVSLDRATSALVALRRELTLEQMTLIGWSGYGMEMAVYALAHPDRVRRLVPLNPAPPRQQPFMPTRAAGMRERVDGAAWARLQSLSQAGSDPREPCRAYNRAMAPAFSANPEASVSVADRWCALENAWPDRRDKCFAAFMPSIAQLDLRTRVRERKMPRLVVHGERDLIPLAGVRAWIPDDTAASVQLVVMPGAEHTSFIDPREAVWNAIDAFLR